MLHRKDDPRYQYAAVMRAGEEAGFKVTDVHYHLRDMRDGQKQEYMETDIVTPYTYAGEPVRGVVYVNPSLKDEQRGATSYSGEKLPGVRQYQDCGLYLKNGKSLEDVSEQDTGSRAFVVMKGSEPVAGMKALDEMGQFAAAASHYPSVASYDEYLVLMENNYKKVKADELGMKPDEDAYLKYLEHQRRFAEDPHAKLIGKATTPEQIQDLINDFQMKQVMDEQKALESGGTQFGD